jgi:hypothetical protein
MMQQDYTSLPNAEIMSALNNQQRQIEELFNKVNSLEADLSNLVGGK